MGKHHDKIFRYPFGGREWVRTTGSSEFTRLLYHEFRRTPELPQPYCFSGFGTEYLSSPVSPKPFTNIENTFRTVKLFMKKSLPFFGAFRTVPVMGQFKRTIRYRSLFLLFFYKIFIIKKIWQKVQKEVHLHLVKFLLVRKEPVWLKKVIPNTNKNLKNIRVREDNLRFFLFF